MPSAARLVPERNAGFTLLELLVAMVILAMGIGLIYRATGGNMRATAEAEMQQRAVWMADALLVEYALIPEGPLQQLGQLDQLEWQVRSSAEAFGVDQPGRLRLRELFVTVRWPSLNPAAGIELRTLVPEYRRSDP